MAAHAEIELKLETDAGGVAAVRGHPLLKGVSERTVDQATTYFDDAKGTLRKAGVSLRVRSVAGGFVQTVKQQDNGSAGLFARPEWESAVEGPRPDRRKLARTPVPDLIDDKSLQPIVQVDARRSTWDLGGPGSALELVLDEGTVAGGEACESIAEIEIELKDGAPASLFDMGRQLAEVAPLRIGVLTKAERGQRLADGSAGKPARAERIRLSEEMTVAEGFAAIAYGCLRQFRLNEALVMNERDPGALHQARVAMRRLRSAFSLFRPAIEDERFPALRDELRWFTDQLGEARNLDVLLRRIGEKRGAGLKALAQLLGEAREEAYDRMVQALGSQRLRLLLFDIVAWIETGPWRQRRKAARPLGGFATRALTKRWHKVRERAALLAGVDPETRHELRIEVKKLRYAAEFLTSLVTDRKDQARQKKFLDALEAMQEQLGELNDRETARQLLADLLARRNADRPVAAAAKRLADNGRPSQRPVRQAEKAAARLLAAGPYWH